MRIRIFAEDYYGKQFFPRLIQRLKNENRIPRNLSVRLERLPDPCNTKLDRYIKSDIINNFDKFIIIADGHNHPKETEKKLRSHVPRKFRKNVKMIVFKYEIEEWICKSLNIAYKSKPSAMLKRLKNYHKRDLLQYVEKLDFEKLGREITFQGFLKAVQG